jgi:hypothetical protein
MAEAHMTMTFKFYSRFFLHTTMSINNIGLGFLHTLLNQKIVKQLEKFFFLKFMLISDDRNNGTLSLGRAFLFIGLGMVH